MAIKTLAACDRCDDYAKGADVRVLVITDESDGVRLRVFVCKSCRNGQTLAALVKVATPVGAATKRRANVVVAP